MALSSSVMAGAVSAVFLPPQATRLAAAASINNVLNVLFISFLYFLCITSYCITVILSEAKNLHILQINLPTLVNKVPSDSLLQIGLRHDEIIDGLALLEARLRESQLGVVHLSDGSLADLV